MTKLFELCQQKAQFTKRGGSKWGLVENQARIYPGSRQGVYFKNLNTSSLQTDGTRPG